MRTLGRDRGYGSGRWDVTGGYGSGRRKDFFRQAGDVIYTDVDRQGGGIVEFGKRGDQVGTLVPGCPKGCKHRIIAELACRSMA
eukprot:3217052-Rhodomonas_salina.1